MFSSPRYVVRTTKRASGNSLRISRMHATPLICSRRRSITVRSGTCSRKSAIASSPLPVSATTVMSGCVSMIVLMPTRTTGWSSTTSTLIFVESLTRIVSHYPSHHSLLARNGDAHRCASRRIALNLQVATQQAGSFLHPQNSIVRVPEQRRAWIETASVITDLDLQIVLREAYININVLRIRVREGVRKSFPNGHHEFMRRRLAKLERNTRDTASDRDSGVRLKLSGHIHAQ